MRRAEASVAAAMQAEVAPPPPPSNSDKPVSPKIDKIANDITALNLIEVAQLSDLLKKRLNLPDVPAMSAIASPLQPVVIIVTSQLCTLDFGRKSDNELRASYRII